jgi:transposase InsO family protein
MRPHLRLRGPRRRPSGTWTSIHPGQLVQLDCFCIGRLQGTKGTVWQDTAIDVASASTWATLQVTRRNPSATWTSAQARQVAADLAARGWKLERVMSDNAAEFRSATSQQTVARLGARHTFIRAGRPQTMRVDPRRRNGLRDCPVRVS